MTDPSIILARITPMEALRHRYITTMFPTFPHQICPKYASSTAPTPALQRSLHAVVPIRVEHVLRRQFAALPGDLAEDATRTGCHLG